MPTIKGLAKRLSILRGQIYVDLSGHNRDSVLICGMQRSGTTWLGDVVNYDNEYRSIYEPFHNRRVPQVAHFKNWQYLRPDDNSPEYLDPATAVFDGRIRSAWMSAYNKRFIARRRLIKDVRCLMMIGWIRKHFPEMPVILLFRHPCAALNSMLKLHWRSSSAEGFLSQPQLMEDHLEPFRADIEAATNDVDDNLVAWCANYYVALRQLAGQRVFVAFYEPLLIDPRNEIARLFKFLGRTFDDRVFAQMTVPSVQVRVERFGDSSAVVSGGDIIDGWRKHITPAQQERALALLKRFGLDSIYGPESMPRVADLTQFGIPKT
jgi:Sulfotransferase family